MQAETTIKRKSMEIDNITKKPKVDQLDTEGKMRRLKTLLQANNQALPRHGGESKLLDRLADCIVFGCPLPCAQCKEGNIVYSSSEQSYVCTGYISEYTRCMYTCRNPPRKPFIIPDEIKRNISEFKDFKIKVVKV
ncbi:hypothetical protein WUBG_09491, partial [Wuchereria bancrofti]